MQFKEGTEIACTLSYEKESRENYMLTAINSINMDKIP